MRPAVTRQGVTRLDARAVCSVSYDGLVTTDSFQKNGLSTHRGHQYAARYTPASDAVVARRALGAGDRSTPTLPHRPEAGDGRNALAGYGGSRWTALGERTGATGTYTNEHAPSTARNTHPRGHRPRHAGPAARPVHLAGAGRGRHAWPRRPHQPRHRPGAVHPPAPDHPLMNQESRFIDVPVPAEVHRYDALGAARGRLRPAGVTVT
ncbi:MULTISPECIES: hypothetical protein [Streptomyces]|uniref:Uncharacterized protein n=1 Tax=Streptomyces canarius TaxID=285453 RepID=A0ABQ3CP00_9ACTN|nr:hypothetical protein [Streptomyces canarius]GHA28732.1 hypothetical protein GCM10010345_36880 [Streptomyces canarius]